MGRLLLSRRKSTLGQGNNVGVGREVGISTGEARAPRVEKRTENKMADGESACAQVPDYSGSWTGEFLLGVDGNTEPLEISMLSKKCRSIWLEGASLVAHRVKNLPAMQETQV